MDHFGRPQMLKLNSETAWPCSSTGVKTRVEFDVSKSGANPRSPCPPRRRISLPAP